MQLRHSCARHVALVVKTRGSWRSSHIASEQLIMNLSMKNGILLVKLCFREVQVIKGYEKKCGQMFDKELKKND